MAFRWRFDVRLIRPEAFLVDFRDAFPVAESSRPAPPFRAARFETLREPLLPPPAFRSLALTPGCAVSTGKSRRGPGDRFFFGTLASRCCWDLKASDLVAMRFNTTGACPVPGCSARLRAGLARAVAGEGRPCVDDAPGAQARASGAKARGTE
jgi:hypothetical protein